MRLGLYWRSTTRAKLRARFKLVAALGAIGHEFTLQDAAVENAIWNFVNSSAKHRAAADSVFRDSVTENIKRLAADCSQMTPSEMGMTLYFNDNKVFTCGSDPLGMAWYG